MDFILYMLFGMIVGVIANALDPRPSQGGLIGAMTLGVLGALTGGYLSAMIFGGTSVTGLNIPSFIVALLGAGILLLIGRALRRA